MRLMPDDEEPDDADASGECRETSRYGAGRVMALLYHEVSIRVVNRER